MRYKTLFLLPLVFFGLGIPAFPQSNSVSVTVTPDPATVGVPFQGESYNHVGDFVIHDADYDIVLIRFGVIFTSSGTFSIQVKEKGETVIFQTCMVASNQTGTLVEVVLRGDFCCFPETMYQVNCAFRSDDTIPMTIDSIEVQAYRQVSSGLYPFFPKTYRPYMMGPQGKTSGRAGYHSMKNPDSSEQLIEYHVIAFGALLDLSGPLSSIGKSCEAVLETAIADFNQNIKNATADQPVFEAQCITYDTKSDSQLALDSLRQLRAQGIRFVIGPTSSAEASAIKSYADDNGMILISPASTVPSLAIAGDSLYRFTVDDTHQGKILPEFMKQAGIKTLVSIYRNDNYGQALSEAVQANFSQNGGIALAPVSYDPDETDFSSLVSKLNEQVQAALEKYSADAIAVHVAAFGEIVEILELASAYPALAQARWFGCDAQPQDTKILENPTVAQFAYKTCFTAPIFGGVVNSSQECQDISQRAGAISQTDISTQALATYDTFQVVVKAIQQANYATSADSIRTEIEQVANHYYGITGAAALNEAGDRKVGNFDFWNIQKKEDGAYAWVKTGILIETDGSFPDIIYYRGCPCNSTSSVSFSPLHN
jgi:branched-chain amino acid transport system substrate-binding protein